MVLVLERWGVLGSAGYWGDGLLGGSLVALWLGGALRVDVRGNTGPEASEIASEGPVRHDGGYGCHAKAPNAADADDSDPFQDGLVGQLARCHQRRSWDRPEHLCRDPNRESKSGEKARLGHRLLLTLSRG